MSESESRAARPIRVLVVDDHRMFAESLAMLLNGEDDLEVVGVAVTAGEGLELAQRLEPRVVIVDHHLPDGDGVSLTAELKRRDPARMVVMLTGHAPDRVLLAAVEAGCSCFLTKDRAAAEVVAAVRSAAAGEALVPPDLLARLLPALARPSSRPSDELTERERQILQLLALGWSNAEIADDLHLSINTVRNYVQSVLHKLGAHSRLEAVATGVRAGLVEYPAMPGARR